MPLPCAENSAADISYGCHEFVRPVETLKNQKALVTGASSGIGEACALALGAAGAAVVINFRSDAEEANRVVEAIRRRGSDATALQADVSRKDQVQAMFNEMKKPSARSTLN